MSEIEQRVRAQASEKVRLLNPHIFKAPVHHGKPMPEMSVKVEKRKTTDEEKLNRWESQWLQVLRENLYPWIGVQNLMLKLADDLRYLPDFTTVGGDGKITCWEIKGFKRPKNMQKLKMAARLFTWIQFVLVTKVDGAFQQEIVKP